MILPSAATGGEKHQRREQARANQHGHSTPAIGESRQNHAGEQECGPCGQPSRITARRHWRSLGRSSR